MSETPPRYARTWSKATGQEEAHLRLDDKGELKAWCIFDGDDCHPVPARGSAEWLAGIVRAVKNMKVLYARDGEGDEFYYWAWLGDVAESARSPDLETAIENALLGPEIEAGAGETVQSNS